jgi:hypothetical protein
MRSLALASIALVACSIAPSTEPTGETRQEIIRGIDSDSSQDSVVLIYAQDLDEACSGTLIAPNLVLTARHCVSRTQMVSFGCDMQGNAIGISGSQILGDHAPKDLLVYTGSYRANAPTMTPDAVGVKIFHDTAKNLCGHDVSLLLLDKDIPNALIAPIRLDDTVTVGETYTAVGWGVTLTAVFPTYRQQRKGVKILSVGPAAQTSMIPETPPNDFGVGESICAGDSGGPALDTNTSAVIGVTSRGGNGVSNPNGPAQECTGAINFYTQTSAYKDLILQAFAESGHDPWVENGPDPRKAKFGEACGSADDCRSAICTTWKSTPPYCGQDCGGDPTSCPMGYVCADPGDNTRVCLPQTNGPKTGGGTTTTSCAASGSAPSTLSGLTIFALFALLRRRR